MRAGALAAKIQLRNALPETVPGRMRAVATKLADWHRPQGAHAEPGWPLPPSRHVRGSGPVWLRSSGGRVERVGKRVRREGECD